MAKQKKHPQGTIAQNKKAMHDYFVETRFEAGLVLAGWEVKSLRADREVQRAMRTKGKDD